MSLYPGLSQNKISQAIPRINLQPPTHLYVNTSHQQSQIISRISQSHLSNQRISTVSSNKVSQATKADHLINTTILSSQSSVFPSIIGNARLQNTSIYPSPNNFTSRIIPSVLNIQQSRTIFQNSNQQSHPLTQVAYEIPSASQRISHYIHQQSNPYLSYPRRNIHINESGNIQTPVVQHIDNARSDINLPIIKAEPIVRQSLLSSMPTISQSLILQDKLLYEQVIQPAEIKPIREQQTIQIKKIGKFTISQNVTQLVGSVTVQNFNLPPKIKTPHETKNNRLYKSAVFGRSTHLVRPASRAHSTKSFSAKCKKRDVYIRCPHRSFISNKKIPVIGAYYSTDKSKNFVIRQLASHGSKVLAQKVVGGKLIEVIPTEIIKIPIGKAEELRDSQYCEENSVLVDDFHSFSSNPILDQPGLIKKFVPVKSCMEGRDNDSLYKSSCSSRSRFSDNIKVSIYRSPSVIIKKAETITSEHKLIKSHVRRIAVEGKLISPFRPENIQNKSLSSQSSKKSSPYAARYQNISKYKLNNITSNPYSQNHQGLQPSMPTSLNLSQYHPDLTYQYKNTPQRISSLATMISTRVEPLSIRMTQVPNVQVQKSQSFFVKSRELKNEIEKQLLERDTIASHASQAISFSNIYEKPLNPLFQGSSSLIESKFQKFETTMSFDDQKERGSKGEITKPQRQWNEFHF